MNLNNSFEFLTGHEWERAPESPCGACPDRDGQLLQAPPTAEQREQQHLEEGQKFKQQVQKQRADNQQRAAEAAKHKPLRIGAASTKLYIERGADLCGQAGG